MSAAPLAYAAARVHARHGARPDGTAWRRLDGARTPAQYLHYAREAGLRRWLRTVAEDDPQGLVELKLRGVFREHVVEVAGWLPRTARPAARWIAALVDLPARAYLHAGGTPQVWMAEDPVLKPLLEADTGPAETEPPGTAWHARWLRLWPGAARDPVAVRLGHALHDLALGDDPPAAAARLHRLFRNHGLGVAGICAYLGLTLDDLQRLAGGLARRRPGSRRFEEAA